MNEKKLEGDGDEQGTAEATKAASANAEVKVSIGKIIVSNVREWRRNVSTYGCAPLSACVCPEGDKTQSLDVQK